MAFAIFLLYVFLTFLRPGEQFAQLREWAIMDIASGLALAATVVSVLTGRSPTFRAAQLLGVIVLWLWAFLSVVLSPVRSDSALDGVLGFGKSSATAFLLVALNVVSSKRIRIVAFVMSLLGLVIGLQAAIGYESGFGAAPIVVGGSARPAPDSDLEPLPEDVTRPKPTDLVRIRGVGLFGDPNDLAITLLALLPLCVALRRDGAWFSNALFVWLPVALITYSVYLTRSRSGVVALAAVLMVSLRHRIGNVLSVGIGVLALLVFVAVGFIGGRSLELDQSAMGRIHAWSDGLQMLKSSPIWGIGFGMFTQYHPRAAHSSYVQCFAELGLVGYLLWLGVILLTLDQLMRVAKNDADPSLARWARGVSHSLIGSLVGALFLSRAYDVVLFVQLGLGTAVVDVARRDGFLAQPRSLPVSLSILLGAAAGSIVAFWLYMRVFR
jgi:hypothetical protein